MVLPSHTRLCGHADGTLIRSPRLGAAGPPLDDFKDSRWTPPDAVWKRIEQPRSGGCQNRNGIKAPLVLAGSGLQVMGGLQVEPVLGGGQGLAQQKGQFGGDRPETATVLLPQCEKPGSI